MGIQPIRKIVVPEIPDKLYFRIGDVARLCEVPAYVLRFWETEFPQLKPNKGGTGQRLYRKRDVEMALRIKSLLYDQGYTIPGARQVFKTEARARETAAEPFAASLPEPSAAAPTPAVAQPEAAQMAPPAPAAAIATPHSSDYDAGAEVRRQVKLHALRAELQALLEILQTPLRTPLPGTSLPGTATQPVLLPKPQPPRPGLVLEPPAPPRPKPAPASTLRLVSFAARDGSHIE